MSELSRALGGFGGGGGGGYTGACAQKMSRDLPPSALSVRSRVPYTIAARKHLR